MSSTVINYPTPHHKKKWGDTITIPPHTIYNFQLFDVSCYKPVKMAYSQVVVNWIAPYPRNLVTIYDISKFVSLVQIHGLTAQNIVSGFQRMENIFLKPKCVLRDRICTCSSKIEIFQHHLMKTKQIFSNQVLNKHQSFIQ